jgi:ATP-dependent RNA helicase DDX19/DBP5
MSSLSGAKAAINPTVPAAAVAAAAPAGGPPTPAAPASEQPPKRKTGGGISGPSHAAAKPPLVVPTIQHKHNDQEGDELTRRLQKLALERQKESKNERLRVIQNDPSQTHLTSAKTFQELNLPTHLMDAIFAMGFDRPSAIQEEALPRILANPPHNLIGQAQSGSGKTVAFTLGMLYRIVIDHPATTQALCVSPTRELAIQIVDQAVRPMAANMAGLKIELAVAGVKTTSRSIDAHIVVGTPGKVVDWIKRKYINAKTIKVFVLDEADNSTFFVGVSVVISVGRNVLVSSAASSQTQPLFPSFCSLLIKQ